MRHWVFLLYLYKKFRIFVRQSFDISKTEKKLKRNYFHILKIPKRINALLSDSQIGEEVNETTIFSIVLITLLAWYLT